MKHITKVIIIGLISSFLFFLAYNSGYAGDVDKGKKVYENYCITCHGPEGSPQTEEVPDFSKGERLDKDKAELIALIKKGHKQKTPPMPSLDDLYYSDTELENVLSYIFSLRK